MLKFTVLTALFGSFTFAEVANSGSNGVTASLDVDIIEQAKDTYFTTVLNIINGLEIPDIEFDGGYVKENVFTVDEQAFDVHCTPDIANNAFVLTNNNLSAGFKTGNFYYDTNASENKVASGRAEVDMNTIKIQAGLRFSIQTLKDGRVVPAFESADVDVEIKRSDIKIHLHGSFWTGFAALFEGFFKGPIADAIESSLTTALSTTFPQVASSFAAKSDGYAKPFKFIGHETAVLDWETKEPVTVDAFRISAGMKGLFFDSEFGQTTPEGEIPDMLRHDTHEHAGLQLFASAWSMNAFSTTLFQEVDLVIPLLASQIPQFTTSFFNTGLPGISDYYGPDQPVDVYLNIISVQDITTKSNDKTISGMSALKAQVYVHTTEGKVELANDIDASEIFTEFTVLIDDMALAGNITSVNIGKVKSNYCSFGRVPLTTEKIFLNKMINLFMPEIDKFLNSKELPLPTELFGLFKLQDLVIKYYDDYIMLGMTPTFEPLAYPSNYFIPEVSMDESAVLFLQ